MVGTFEPPADGARWNGGNWSSPDWLRIALAKTERFANFLRPPMYPIQDHPDTASFTDVGPILFRIQDFDVKSVARNIVFHGTPSAPVAEPQSATPYRTRWDMTTTGIFKPSNGKQRSSLIFVLDDILVDFFFFWGFPITAKSKASQKVMANPEYDWASGRWAKVDLLYDPADPEMIQMAEYNISVAIKDRAEPETYTLPIVIDPRMENRG